MGALWSIQQMNLNLLAQQFVSKVEAAGSSRILVTSVSPGDGKSKFLKELEVQLRMRRGTEFSIVDWQRVLSTSPDDYGHELVLVHGVSYMDAEGLFRLPERWLKNFDTAVIVVKARRTKISHLEQLCAWLREAGIRNQFVIWNEHEAPAIENVWLRIRRRMGYETAPVSAPAAEIADREAHT